MNTVPVRDWPALLSIPSWFSNMITPIWVGRPLPRAKSPQGEADKLPPAVREEDVWQYGARGL